MKSITRFFAFVLCAVPLCAAAAPVATTAGSNLTAYNPTTGATNNNMWNTLMNGRGAAGGNNAAPADFGNCNALIIRCASPKCANGGCTDMDVASSIVRGCVNSNENCKKYGDDLVEYISAQLVASSNAKINAANVAAQNATAAAVAQQNAQQMAEMQQQMQQMQAEMAQQNAATVQAMQAALDEQKQLTADAIANANATQQSAPSYTAPVPTNSEYDNGLTNAQIIAAQNGVSADVLAREQIVGEIMSKLENAETALKTLKTTMQDAFDYAGCDSFGNNCSGPKRVSAFKSRAIKFFDPYNTVLDELYDALITAQAAGVDITDIYMMLEGSCNVWGQYLCSQTELGAYADGSSLPKSCDKNTGKSIKSGSTKGGRDCVIGQPIPPEDSPLCTLQKTYADGESVRRAWLYPEEGDDETQGGAIRVGCASSALDNSKFFRSRKKQAQIDIEILERIIEQDASASSGFTMFGARRDDGARREQTYGACAIGETMYADLQKITATKKLPDKICMKQRDAIEKVRNDAPLALATGGMSKTILKYHEQCEKEDRESVTDYWECLCPKIGNGYTKSSEGEYCSCGTDSNKYWGKDNYYECLTDDQICTRKQFCTGTQKSQWNQTEKTCGDCK